MDAPRAQSISSHTPDHWIDASDGPVDLVHLRRYTLGDKALEIEVLELFLAQLPETIASMRSAANERDWKIAAHTLKGSSRAVGAWRIATLAQEAEELPAEAESTAWSDAISRLETAASEARAFVRETATRA
jgi:HPt (histidine-containing phosphotransfer) domain-containing protein